MHINPNFLKNLEELCLKKQGYQNYNSRFHRDFESFGYCEDLKDDYHKNTLYKRYDELNKKLNNPNKNACKSMAEFIINY